MTANSFKMRYIVTPRYLPKPSKRRPGDPLTPGVKFIVAHDSGNPGSTAAGNVAYYARTSNDESASAHIFVDDQEILECIPALTQAPEKAWHVIYDVPSDNQLYGYNANDAAIGVEYCYGGKIDADEAYRKYVWVLACLCHSFELDPAMSIVGHFFLDPARRTDPVTGLATSRRTYDHLLRDVVAEFGICSGDAHRAPPTFVTAPGQAVAAARLCIRRGAPSRYAERVQVVSPGTMLPYEGWVTDGEVVNGNGNWYRDTNGNYFWSGGVRQEAL
jgi:hypothetical protein